MQKRVALVTGAASGIGFAIAEGLAEDGFHVIVTDLSVESAQAAAETIAKSTGGSVEAVKLDVSSQAEIDSVCAGFPQIDILVNNAGIQHVSRLEDFPPEKWRLINDVLLVGPAMLTRAALPKMYANNYGRIINIGSLHGVVASPFKSAYVAAKHGLIGFSKVIALETAEHDITINTVCPAYVKTPLVEKQIASQAKEHGITEEEVVNRIMLEPMPKKSFISLDEMVGAVRFLISPAARNMTAQAMVLDGAWTAR